MATNKDKVPETWYGLFDCGGKPEAKELTVVSSTPKFVTVAVTPAFGEPYTCREAIDSDANCIRRTERECYEWLIEQRTNAVAAANDTLHYAKRKLVVAKQLLDNHLAGPAKGRLR